MKYSAEQMSLEGDKYLGTSYKQLDCQAFVEKCMADVGYKRNLPGSNAWYRAMTWTGTPEECMKTFGCVPKGAFLFILSNNGKEPEKYRNDGIGNASHIGMKTGRGDGAIHSSSSRGCVATSVFKDKTIPNGGWNRVGLLDVFSYGKSVDWLFEHGVSEPAEDPVKEPDEGGMSMQGKVVAESGSTVKLRQKPSTGCPVYWDIPIGSSVEIIEHGATWSKIITGGLTGWMMTQFIQADGDEPVAPDPGEDYGDDSVINRENVTITLSAAQAATILPVLDAICEQIVMVVGRG